MLPVKIVVFLFCVALTTGCRTFKPYYSNQVASWRNDTPPDSSLLIASVYFLGNVGAKTSDSAALKRNLAQVKSQIGQSHTKNVVVFTGDWLPTAQKNTNPVKADSIVNQTLSDLSVTGADNIFIPGNEEWEYDEKKPEQFLIQISKIASEKGGYVRYVPENGLSGPVIIPMANDIVAIALDSEWWLHPVAAQESGFGEKQEKITAQLKKMLKANRDKHIVILQHHPFVSNGEHGGSFTIKDHLFPLTRLNRFLYVPLPFIGSVYPLLRKGGISSQDIANKKYQVFKREMQKAIGTQKNVVIAAANDQLLQLNRHQNSHYILSGSASASAPFTAGKQATFVTGAVGFAKLNYYKNGQSWVEFWASGKNNDSVSLQFRNPLYAMSIQKQKDLQTEKGIHYQDSFKVMAAGDLYNQKKYNRKLFGQHYRTEWSTPVKTPYLDLSAYAGGLAPVAVADSTEHEVLVLTDKTGKLYRFKSFDKKPSLKLPEKFSETLAEDILADQSSSSYPFASLIIPYIAKAVGIYYQQTELLYLPNTRLLGTYIQQSGGEMGVLQTAPADAVYLNHFGTSNSSITTDSLYKELEKSNNISVDEALFLRTRLFDLLVGDFDRGEAKWLWVESKDTSGLTLYKPVALEREWAFSKFDGFLPSLASLSLPDFQNFGLHIEKIKQLMLNAKNLDRNLLTHLSSKEWIAIAQDIKTKLSDEVIDQAVKNVPKEVYNASALQITTNLKARRNELVKAAEAYYELLAKRVNIITSDQKEFIYINREQKSTTVRVVREDQQEIYRRTFYNKETDEINIFALNNSDHIVFEGIRKGILIHVIGKKDSIINSGPEKNNSVYEAISGKQKVYYTDTYLKENKLWSSFSYNTHPIAPYVNYNTEDGVFLGFGFGFKQYGFNKNPYANDQFLAGNFAPKTRAYNLYYTGTFYSVFNKKTDILLNAIYFAPKYSFNYYGQGNGTLNLFDVDYYRINSTNLSLAAYFQYRLTNKLKMGIGPGFDRYSILKPIDRYVSSTDFPDKQDILKPENYGLLKFFTEYSSINNAFFPTTGINWKLESNYYAQLQTEDQRFLLIRSEIGLYHTIQTSLPFTFAFRFGSATNIGNYRFFQANTLGGNVNLRGYRNNRFSGRSYLYQNAEIRMPISDFNTYLINGSIGFFGFFDSGRVFYQKSESNRWHSGYGPGIWLNLYNKLIVSGSLGFSKEGTFATVKSGLTF